MKKTASTQNCDHCRKKDCERCVKDGGMNFCCTYCCEDYKKRKAANKIHESVNVCKYC